MGVLSPILYAALAFGVFQWLAPRFSAEEQRWLRISLGAHVLFAFANVFLTVYLLGGGDMLWYHRDGSKIADLWWSNPGVWTEEVVKLTLRLTARFPFWIHGASGSNSTGAMFGISAWLMILTGKSLYGACVIVSCLNFFSRLAMYAVVRRLLDPKATRLALFAIMLFPSALFWTGGLLKEGVAMVGIGYTFYGAYRIAEHSDFVRGAFWVVVGGFTSYLVKPYVLFPFAIGIPIWYLAARIKRDSQGAGALLTPFRLVAAGGIAVGGLALLAYLVPALSIETLSDEIAQTQDKWDRVSAASSAIQISRSADRGLLGVLISAPMGLVNALTRPWLFEARNPQRMFAAVENTLLLILLFLGLRRNGAVSSLRALLSEPVVLFCLAYFAIFGVAVGISTGNIGSISRYRAPLLAFYGVFIVFLYATGQGAEKVVEARVGEQGTASRRRSSRDPVTGRRRPLRARERLPVVAEEA